MTGAPTLHIESGAFLPDPCDDLKCQCGKDADPLTARFAYDIPCETLDRLKARGVTREDLLELKEHIPGVKFPWNEDYDSLRINYNRRFNVFPWVICMCRKTREVAYAVKWCVEHKLKISMRSGAHCYEPYSLGDEVIIDQSRRTRVHVEDGTGLVRIDPGVRLGPLVLALSKYGLAVPSGTCPNVCAAGLALGGGLGFLQRKYGCSCDNLVALQMVHAEGDVITADAKHNAELFRALQGAGIGNYGIVVGMVFRAHKVRTVRLIEASWSFDKANHVIDAFQRQIPDAPRDLSAELEISHPGTPIPFTGMWLGSKKALNAVLDRFFAAASQPDKLTIEKIPYVDAARKLGANVRRLPFFVGKSIFYDSLISADHIDALLSQLPNAPKDPTERTFRVIINAFGGAISDAPVDATGFIHRGRTRLWLQLFSHWNLQPMGDASQAEAQRYFEHAMARGVCPLRCYQNSPDSALGARGIRAYYGENLGWLRRTKTRYDPRNIFNYAQSIPPYAKK